MLGEFLRICAPAAHIGWRLRRLDRDPAGQAIGLAQLGLAGDLDLAERAACVEWREAVEALQM